MSDTTDTTQVMAIWVENRKHPIFRPLESLLELRSGSMATVPKF